MNKCVPLSVPNINGNEWRYLKQCLDNGWVSTAGELIEQFESDICALTGARHAVACVNGTAALHTALQIIGVQSADEVIVPTVTFIAPVNAVSYTGAQPVFMDCDEYYNIDVAKTVEFIENQTLLKNGHTYNKTTGRRIHAVIPVHTLGNAADLEHLIPICRQRNIRIVEDAAESLGTYYINGGLEGRHTGTIGDIGCYSFNGNKIITAGGGGAIVTNNADYAKKAKYLTTQAKDDQTQYIHNEIGYNYRLTNIQAAIGIAQLEKLPEHITAKKQNYHIYKTAIEQVSGLHLADVPKYASNNHWMYALQVSEQEYGKDKLQLMASLAQAGIQARPLWYLNHLQKPYRNCQSYKIEKALEMHRITLNIPCSVNLDPGDLYYVTEVLKK